jgi:DNA-binding response OmpR family regulator/HPt (histidine-containing phosphotransfer) domain-containing protein
VKKLLIIEDDPIIGNIYRNLFEKENYKVDVAADGQSGFYKIHELRPDVVLLDLMLPVINGVEILKKIRAQRSFLSLPVVVFTNAYLPDMVQEAMKAGARHVYNKSTLSPRDICQAVHDCLFSPQANGGSASEPASNGNGTPTATASASRNPNDMCREFMNTAPELLSAIRISLQMVVKADNEAARLTQINELYRRVHTMSSGASLATLRTVAQYSAALEALLKELYDQPRNINASTLRTLAHAVDFLSVLFANNCNAAHERPISVMVVDDELLSRKAVVMALDKAHLKPVAMASPEIALALAGDNAFDLVVLDVDMPGMNGFELCAKLRTLPAYKSVPVVFVTSLTDFENRAKSMMSGGNDFIAKPFLFTELTVKALTYVMKGRQPATPSAAAALAASPAPAAVAVAV